MFTALSYIDTHTTLLSLMMVWLVDKHPVTIPLVSINYVNERQSHSGGVVYLPGFAFKKMCTHRRKVFHKAFK
jgi:hypothetical protein